MTHDTLSPQLTAPSAPERLVEHSEHGHVRRDEWAWLRDDSRADAEVLAHLEAENAFTSAWLDPLSSVSDAIFDEIKRRVVEDDSSVPVPRRQYAYYQRTEEGRQYPVLCRSALQDGPEEVLLDVNAVAAGHDFCSLGLYAVSPDETRLAYSVDVTGAEQYELRLRDLATGVEDVVARDVAAGGAFAADSRTLIYVRLDATHRPFQAWVAAPSEDEHRLLVQEDDERFFLGVTLSRDEHWLLIGAQSKETAEWWAVSADRPNDAPVSIAGRRTGVLYTPSPHTPSGRMLLLTNDGAPDGKIVATSWPEVGEWTELVPQQPGLHIDGALVLQNHLVLQERHAAATRLRVLDLETGELRALPRREDVATIALGANARFDTSVVRYGYESMTQPQLTLDVDLITRNEQVLKELPVRGHDPSLYITERVWANSADGTDVPISVVRRRDTELGSPPALVYAYGSYQHSMDPSFSVPRLSLLDRGFVFAIVHARGGGELGRAWYDNGKRGNKRNTFLDLEAAVQHLQATGYAGRTVLRGGSAGGLMVGAVLNAAPELFVGAVAEVPFVDVATTMSDPTLPLTVAEYEEWGDPRTPDAFGDILGYSPYDNIGALPYPPVLATAGLHDPRVGYWEPAKWVQRLRKLSTSAAPVLLRTEMGAGHGGRTGRYAAWEREAEVLAFVVACATDTLPTLGENPAS